MFKVHQFDSLNRVEHFLNGGITGSGIPVDGVTGLVGETITFTSPASACTFAAGTGPDSSRLLFGDIKSQMETQISGLKVVYFGRGEIGFILSTPSAACALGATEQLARTKLGMPKAGVITGKLVLDPANVGTPRLVHTSGALANQYTLYVWE